jgi:hypothetical protein
MTANNNDGGAARDTAQNRDAAGDDHFGLAAHQ